MSNLMAKIWEFEREEKERMVNERGEKERMELKSGKEGEGRRR